MMKPMHSMFAFAVVSLASGCSVDARYVMADGMPNATALIVVDSDTVDVTGRFYDAFLFPDNRCPVARKNMLGRKLQAKPHEEFASVKIPAGAPIMIGVTSSDARMAMNRECGYQARFTPEPDQAYRIHLTTTHDGNRCDLKISDASGNAVAYEEPEEVCLPSIHQDAVYRNGIGHDVIWRIRVQSY